MAEFGFELDEIKRLIKLVEDRGLERLRVEDQGRVIEILGPVVVTAVSPAAPSASTVDLPVESPAAEERDADELPEEGTVVVASPVVGVFYRSQSPDSAPFVEVGDRIEVGQTVGLIEAMKVFSEVASDHAGVVTTIAAESGQLVRQSEPLLYLRPE